MALNLANVQGTGVKVNGLAASNGQTVTEPDLVETTQSGNSVQIKDGGQTAANVSGTNSTITTFSPPTQGLDHIYYQGSYRYRLRTPTGNVGIRG